MAGFSLFWQYSGAGAYRGSLEWWSLSASACGVMVEVGQSSGTLGGRNHAGPALAESQSPCLSPLKKKEHLLYV